MKSYIPTINISSLLKSDFNTLASKNTIRKIEKACVNVGFFQITGHGLDLNQIKKPVKLEINFLIYQSQKKINFHQKNGIKKILIFIEDTFLIM